MKDTLQPRDHAITLRGYDLHYVEWGSPEAPPLVLDHGLQDCARCWEFFAARMAEEYHVVALDHRGHGDSPWAPPQDYRFADTLGELASFIRALGLERPPVVGHSNGARNAMVLAAVSPSLVGRVVIVDIYPDPANPTSTDMVQQYLEQDDQWPSLEAAVECLRGRKPLASEELLRHHAQVLTRPGPGGGLVWKRDRNVVLSYERPDCWHYLEHIQAPTLVVRGAQSGILPQETAERMCQVIPHARPLVVLQGGHWCHEEDPDAFWRAVRTFLRE